MRRYSGRCQGAVVGHRAHPGDGIGVGDAEFDLAAPNVAEGDAGVAPAVAVAVDVVEVEGRRGLGAVVEQALDRGGDFAKGVQAAVQEREDDLPRRRVLREDHRLAAVVPGVACMVGQALAASEELTLQGLPATVLRGQGGVLELQRWRVDLGIPQRGGLARVALKGDHLRVGQDLPRACGERMAELPRVGDCLGGDAFLLFDRERVEATQDGLIDGALGRREHPGQGCRLLQQECEEERKHGKEDTGRKLDFSWKFGISALTCIPRRKHNPRHRWRIRRRITPFLVFRLGRTNPRKTMAAKRKTAKKKPAKKAAKKAPARKAAKKKPARRTKAKKAVADMIISKSRTKNAVQQCNVSGDFYGALNDKVIAIIEEA
ncbi:MAG: hypothetical protein ACPGQD_07000, partial [Planctomycetota bacterium]